MTAFDPVSFASAVLALLNPVSGLTVYDGEVPTTPAADDDGRVHPYAVVYASDPDPRRLAVAGTVSEFDWGFQVTVVGGDRQRCSWAAGKVTAALIDQRLTVSGYTTGRMTRTPGPGISRDDTVQPPRTYQPLLFGLYVTSTT